MIDAKIQPVTRAEALALITTRGRMTRHDYMTATGLGREHGPDGKWWRTQFRAIWGKA